MNRYKELQSYLPGLNERMPKTFEKLAEIFKYQVFELYESESEEHQTDYLIPYMMNDAVEDYLILKNCRLMGTYLTEKELEAEKEPGQEQPETEAEVIEEAEGYVLIVRQGEDHVFTLHFQDIGECVKYYQYHQIGHFWVKGEEQWRQLVYMVGTIYDKYEYMGRESCNEQEMELLRLIEFAPFRHWSPVRESLEERYPATCEGMDAMERLALQAGDSSFAKWIHIYRRIPTRLMERFLSCKLLSPARQSLYQLLCEKIEAASEMYPERDYGEKRNREIQKKREEIHEALMSKGFQGSYPEYRNAAVQVVVTEEHPFTLMEFDNFVFRVQFMVSECGKLPDSGKNCGFFRGKGRRGYILTEEELDKL